MRSHVQWTVELPNPYQLEDGWIELAIFDRRKDAVNFVIEEIGLPRKAAKYFISRIEM
jgi:hypothetical protein